MDRLVIIDSEPKFNIAKENVVFIQYTGKDDLLKLVKCAQRMAPQKIIINNAFSYPPYELNKAKKYAKYMTENGVYENNYYVFR